MKNKDNLMVYKANQVVEASYKLTLNEQRVVLACIAQVHSREALLTTDEFEPTFRTPIIENLNISKHTFRQAT